MRGNLPTGGDDENGLLKVSPARQVEPVSTGAGRRQGVHMGSPGVNLREFLHVVSASWRHSPSFFFSGKFPSSEGGKVILNRTLLV